MKHKIQVFIFLFLFWILLSGKLDPFHLSLGVIACVIVSLWSYDLLIHDKSRTILGRFKELMLFTKYVIWLLYQILLANFHVLSLVFHPHVKKKIKPQIIRFKTKLKSSFAKFVFANSITLTPGTVTIRIVDDEYIVHAISNEAAADLPGKMEEMVSQTFDQ